MADFDKFDLESVVMDLEGAAALLYFVFEQSIDDGVSAWDLLGLKPKPGQKLYLLTDDEARALGRAVDLVHGDVRSLSRLFYRNEAE